MVTEARAVPEPREVKMGDIKPPLPIRTLPEPPPLTVKDIVRWAGPAVILGSLAIGGFEAYHTGYVSSKGLINLFWLYWVSAIFQVFFNREIARWTMATGETIFQGFARIRPGALWAWVGVIACILVMFWPAWIGGAAAQTAALFGGDPKIWAVAAIGSVFILFAVSQYVYRVLEYIMWFVFVVGTGGVVILSLLMTDAQRFSETLLGWLAIGTIPAGATLSAIGPFLQQPLGGAWNAFHTFWLRERGMGMGAYIGRVTGLVARPEEVQAHGFTFDTTDPDELRKWNRWMKLNTITLVVFMFILGGMLFTFFASLAGYSAARIYGMDLPSGWRIAVVLAEIFRSAYGPALFFLFAVFVLISLYDSQYATYDGLARATTDVLWTEHRFVQRGRSYRFWYFVILAVICLASMATIPVGTPYEIWLLLSYIGMFSLPAYMFLTMYINNRYLPAEIRPRWYDNLMVIGFSAFLLLYGIAWVVFEFPPRT
jgi:hypothetical protein